LERIMSNITTRRPHTAWGRAVGIAIAGAVIVVAILLAFVWPIITSSVKDVPIAVAGTSEQVAAVTRALDQKAEGAFEVTPVTDRAAAVDLIKTRDVYGAIVLGPQPEVLTASAGNAAVSQLLGQLAAQLQVQANQQAAAAVQQAIAAGKAPAGTVPPTVTVRVTDVVPLSSGDPRGLGLTAASFPLVLGGIIGGVLISLLVTGPWRRLTSVAVYAVVAGFSVVGIMQGWFGVLQGNFWINGLAVSLAMAATVSLIVGMNALIGRAGIAVGAIITMLIGNPLSSAAQPIQFTVAPWGAIGQWFVPGASATLVRDLSYFPQANATFPWLVLAGWTALGMIAMVAGHFRNQEVVHVEDALEKPADESEKDGALQPA
jgi:hypothetical protein